MNGAPRQFLNALQGLRFLAAVMVLVSHLELELERRSFPTRFPFHDPTGIDWAVGVDIFFIVSGFIMYYLSRHHFGEIGYVREFLTKRVIRVVPLYWLFTTAFLCVAVVLPGALRNADVDVARVLTSYLFIPWPRAAGGVYPILALGWTLNYEMFFYLVFATGLLFPRRTGAPLVFVVFALLVLLGLFVPKHQFIASFFTRPIILDFSFGLVLAMAYARGARLGGLSRATLVLCGTLLLVVFGKSGWSASAWRPVWAGLPCLLIAAGCVLGTDLDSRTRLGKLLVLGGDCSYSLYLSHMFATRSLTLVWQRFQLDGGWLFFVAGLVGCLALALASYVLIEQPLLKLFRRAPAQLKRPSADLHNPNAPSP